MVENITDREFSIHKADFKKFDLDDNDLLPLDEVEALVTHQLQRQPSRKEIEAFIERLPDGDGGGGIDLSKYLDVVLGPGWTRNGETPQAGTTHTCTKADLNKLSREELIAALTALPEAEREPLINEMFSPLLRMGVKAEIAKSAST